MDKPITWSHSALKDFEGCGRRYYEIRVLKNYPSPETEQIRYGKELHTAAENLYAMVQHCPHSFLLYNPRSMR
jgi:hypothetical protein